jgi:hypothetical protein
MIPLTTDTRWRLGKLHIALTPIEQMWEKSARNWITHVRDAHFWYAAGLRRSADAESLPTARIIFFTGTTRHVERILQSRYTGRLIKQK